MEDPKDELAKVEKELDGLKTDLRLAQSENKRLVREHREMAANCESYQAQIKKLTEKT